jgi:hypothetical protein
VAKRAAARRVYVGDELFEARCEQGRRTPRTHGAMRLRDEIVRSSWTPGDGYVEAQTATSWARRRADGDFDVVAVTRTSRQVGAGWRLTSGRVAQARADGRHGVLRSAGALRWQAEDWTIEVQQITANHPAVAYVRATEEAATRVIEALHQLLVPASVCFAAWVARRAPGQEVFDFHYMLSDPRNDVRRVRTRDGFAALVGDGRLVTDLRPCDGCGDPTGGELFRAARVALGLAAAPVAAQVASSAMERWIAQPTGVGER